MQAVGGGTTGGVTTTPVYEGGIVDLDPADAAELDAAACAGWKAEPEPENSILMLVVDTSGSMDVAPAGQSETKWQTTEVALSRAIDNLPATTALGILFYPGRDRVSESSTPRDPSTCVDFDQALPIALLGPQGSRERANIQSALESIRPRGGTPTHDAYDYALEQLKNTQLFGAKNMLLITDGQPTFSQNCVGSGLVSEPVDEAPIVEAVRTARQSDRIRTFVIGSPGSEQSWTGNDSTAKSEDTRPWLSQAARAGDSAREPCSDTGEPYCHFDMSVEPSFADGLSSALAVVSDSIISCSYGLPVPPAGESLDPNAVNVVLTTGSGDTKLVLRDDGSDCSEGWRYADDGGVELCPLSCDRVMNDPNARLQLMFGCATNSDEIPK